jgi:hypothetical protein
MMAVVTINPAVASQRLIPVAMIPHKAGTVRAIAAARQRVKLIPAAMIRRKVILAAVAAVVQPTAKMAVINAQRVGPIAVPVGRASILQTVIRQAAHAAVDISDLFFWGRGISPF